jgi:trehalose/maltose hydrolase-like predicted phosphorylase
MRRFRVALVLVVAVVSAAVVVHAVLGAKGRARHAQAPSGLTVPSVSASGTGSYTLTATKVGPTYAPTFTGNGELGVRVPPTGQGYVAGAVPTESEVAGFYAQEPAGVQVRANIPTWSTLVFSDAGEPFSLSRGVTRDWRQSINFRTGVITTRARWTAPSGHVTDLTYEVSTDRARPDVGLVRLVLAPRWSGMAAVTDAIDGAPATMSDQVAKGWTLTAHGDWVAVRALGTGLDVALASDVALSRNVTAATSEVDRATAQSVGQRFSFPVAAGRSYVITKFVAVVTSHESSRPIVAAQHEASVAANDGYGSLLNASTAAWAALWAGRIDVLGDPSLATAVNASEFYLWSSVRDSVDWSISPSGLSSNGYSGHIFWDAETWMYPALLAQHPDLAATMNTYRFDRLAAAGRHAAQTAYRGIRFPWESALDGTEQIPPPSSVFTEGLYEQHITADIALAQWQYYVATGDQRWLAQNGWPVISGAAKFWASRATLAADGQYHFNGMTGPDEYNENVDDEVYTNAAAITTLQDASQAARALGLSVPADWTRIASKIVVRSDARLGIIPEFSTYRGQLIKQADATLLAFPLGYPIAATVAQNNVDYYASRTDPSGPSMTDAINAIDTAASAAPGCASYVYLQRSEQPFIRDVFDQFSETRTGGAFTFMTGIGGFLQEFIYGTSGLRWNANAVQLAPNLTRQIGGVVLHHLSWHGRRFTLTITEHDTTVALDSGAPLPVQTGTSTHNVTAGHPLTLDTARPDLGATSDAVRCANASASSSQPGAPALAAVDGSPATAWRPATLPAALTIALPKPVHISGATLQWGQQWPQVQTLNQAPPPGPVITRRATSYTIAVSIDGTTWHTVATVTARVSGTSDALHFPSVQARYISVRIAASTSSQTPILDELTAGT